MQNISIFISPTGESGGCRLVKRGGMGYNEVDLNSFPFETAVSGADGRRKGTDMKVIDVYRQYFEADCVFADVPRKGALVTFTAESDEGHITYTFGVTFFPYRDPEDFAISYDCEAHEVVYDAPGRRARKREAQMMTHLRERVDALAATLGGTVYWDRPIMEAQLG